MLGHHAAEVWVKRDLAAVIDQSVNKSMGSAVEEVSVAPNHADVTAMRRERNENGEQEFRHHPRASDRA